MRRILGADGYRYDPWGQSRIHGMDYNQDGRGDLVFWNEDHFEVHTQDERGLFALASETFATDVAFDSDDLSRSPPEDMTGRVLQSLDDLNGDGVGDLVVHSLAGRRISSKQSTYEVHFGARAPDGGTAFASDVGATFQSKGRILLGMERRDFDRDGHVGLVLTSIEVKFLESSLWKRFKGLMGDDIQLDLEFYQTEDGLYPDKPNATRRIALDGVPSHREPGWVPLDIVLRGRTHESRKTQKSWTRAFNRTLLIGDVTGDRRLDLLIESEFRSSEFLSACQGRTYSPGGLRRWRSRCTTRSTPGLRTSTRTASRISSCITRSLCEMPTGAPSRPPGTEPHRLTMLIAR